MTLAELQAYVGAPPVKGDAYFAQRDGLHVTAWEDELSSSPGWWFAVTRPCGLHEVIVAMGWSAGDRRDRDIEIATSIARGRVEDPAVAGATP